MKIKAAVAVILATVMMAVVSVAQDKGGKGAETLTITVKEKGDVKLPHSKHQEVLKDCKVCHDAFPQKAGAINELKASGKLQKKQVMNTQCIKCHNEKKNAGVKSGPVTCSACHS